MKRWRREVMLAVIAGALLAALTIQMDMIARKRAEIMRIVEQQKVLLDRLAQLRKQVEQFNLR
jgi:hypothetical protein